MNTNYEVRRNYCDCHPETCCCNPWVLYYKATGQKVVTCYNRSDAVSLCEKLNALEGHKGVVTDEE